MNKKELEKRFIDFSKSMNEQLSNLKEKVNKLNQAVFTKNNNSFWIDAEALYFGHRHTSEKEDPNNIDLLEEKLDKTEKRLQTILKHFDLEYVEITEKNGSTKEYSKLRKVAKKSKVKK